MNPRGMPPTSIARHHEHDATTLFGDCELLGTTLELGAKAISLNALTANSANLGNLAVLRGCYNSRISSSYTKATWNNNTMPCHSFAMVNVVYH